MIHSPTPNPNFELSFALQKRVLFSPQKTLNLATGVSVPPRAFEPHRVGGASRIATKNGASGAAHSWGGCGYGCRPVGVGFGGHRLEDDPDGQVGEPARLGTVCRVQHRDAGYWRRRQHHQGLLAAQWPGFFHLGGECPQNPFLQPSNVLHVHLGQRLPSQPVPALPAVDPSPIMPIILVTVQSCRTCDAPVVSRDFGTHVEPSWSRPVLGGRGKAGGLQ